MGQNVKELTKPKYDRTALEKQVATNKSKIAAFSEAIADLEKENKEVLIPLIKECLVYEAAVRDRKAVLRTWKAGDPIPKREGA